MAEAMATLSGPFQGELLSLGFHFKCCEPDSGPGTTFWRAGLARALFEKRL